VPLASDLVRAVVCLLRCRAKRRKRVLKISRTVFFIKFEIFLRFHLTKQLDVITLDRRQTNIMTIMLFDFVFFFYFFHHFSRERIFPSSSSSVERACQGHPAASSARPRHRSRGITHRQLPRSQPRAREPAHQPHGHGGSCPTAAARQRDGACAAAPRPGGSELQRPRSPHAPAAAAVRAPCPSTASQPHDPTAAALPARAPAAESQALRPVGRW
jgi:hypothetical protein